MALFENAKIQEFMKAYGINISYPENASEESRRAIDNSFLSQYGHKFELWERVPETVKASRGSYLSSDELYKSSELDETKLKVWSNNPQASAYELDVMIEKEAYKRPDDKVLENMAIYGAAVAAGYTAASALDLANERNFRESILDKMFDKNMSAEEKEAWRQVWRQSREKTRDVILQHKIETTPERALIYLLHKYNKGEMTQEQFMPRLADVIQNIETKGRHQELENLFERKRFHNLYQRLNSDLKELVDGIRENEFAYMKNANLNFKVDENVNMPYDVAKFLENSQKKHQQISQQTNNTMTKQDLRNYISTIRQAQR